MLGPVKLTGEQKKVLMLPPENPVQIKGVAGSGKTTVALYRAKHLLDFYGDLFTETNVAIFTFNKSLASYIQALAPVIGTPDGERGSGIDIKVTNFHKWAWKFLFDNSVELVRRTIAGRNQVGLIARAIDTVEKTPDNARVLGKSKEFFQEEISWMKGQLFSSEDEYFEARRVGRGVNDRIVKKDRITIWKVFESYNNILKQQRHIDFDDYAVLALDIIRSDPNFRPPFSHIVVDEAQDLNKAQIIVLSKLVSETTNSLSIIADAAQRIYKSGFSWAEVGINVRGGRTIEFKKNYRNTKAIADAAMALLDHDPDSAEFTKLEMLETEGDKPIIKGFAYAHEEYSYIADYIDEVTSLNPRWSVCVLHRTHEGVRDIVNVLSENGLEVESIIGNQLLDYTNQAVKVCTMSSIKGLEFDCVIVAGLSSRHIPLPSGYSEPDDELHVTTERRLLYTCMTRAKKALLLSYSGTPSIFLEEIPSEYSDTSR